MPIVPSYHFMIGPAMAVAALVVIVLLCRWVFSTDDRDRRTAARRAAEASRGDYGLLEPVVPVTSRADAERLRGLLVQAGIRCTLAPQGPDPDGPHAVLVFRTDASRARELVTS